MQPDLPLVAEWDQGKQPADRKAFAEPEQIYGTFMTVVAPIANSVIDTPGDQYGFMDQLWWPGTNANPKNARIMEQVALFARFYTLHRRWNIYYRDPALLGRLRAALTYYLNLQNEDGSFTEVLSNPNYNPDDPACTDGSACGPYIYQPLSATSFGTQALASTLGDLKAARALPDLLPRIESALRRAIAWLCDLSQPHWESPVQYTNQVAAGLSATVRTGRVTGDRTLTSLALTRLEYLWKHSHAPAGHTLEPLGYDFPYEFYITLPDLGYIYQHTKSDAALRYAQGFADFVQRAMVWEPDGAGSFHFAAIIVRTASGDFLPILDDARDKSAMDRAFLTTVPSLAPYFPSREQIADQRRAWANSTLPIPPLTRTNQGNTLSPRLWMDVPVAPQAPTSHDQQRALDRNRVIAADRFTELRHSGPGTGDVYLMVRRPGYYYGALYGPRPQDRLGSWYGRLRFGSGLLWHPQFGTLIMSTNNGSQAWTTTAPDDTYPGGTVARGLADAKGSSARYFTGNSVNAPEVHPDDIAGWQDAITTEATFTDITVPISTTVPTITTTLTDFAVHEVVDVGGPAVTRIPLMLRKDDLLTVDDSQTLLWGDYFDGQMQRISILRDDTRATLEWESPHRVMLASTPINYLAKPGLPAARRSRQLVIYHSGNLGTTLKFEDA